MASRSVRKHAACQLYVSARLPCPIHLSLVLSMASQFKLNSTINMVDYVNSRCGWDLEKCPYTGEKGTQNKPLETGIDQEVHQDVKRDAKTPSRKDSRKDVRAVTQETPAKMSRLS